MESFEKEVTKGLKPAIGWENQESLRPRISGIELKIDYRVFAIAPLTSTAKSADTIISLNISSHYLSLYCQILIGIPSNLARYFHLM